MNYAVKIKSAKKPEKATEPTGKIEIIPALVVNLVENFTLTDEAVFGETEGEAMVSQFTVEREIVEVREEVEVDNKELLLDIIEANLAGLAYEVRVHLCTHGTDTPGPCSSWVVERSTGDVPEVEEE